MKAQWAVYAFMILRCKYLKSDEFIFLEPIRLLDEVLNLYRESDDPLIAVAVSFPNILC